MQPAGTVEEFKQQTARKVAHVRCPEHREAPRLKFHGRTLREVSVRMSGCCAKLLEIANRAIAER